MEIIFIPFVLVIWYMISTAIKQEKRNRGLRYFNDMVRNIQECAEDREMMNNNLKKL